MQNNVMVMQMPTKSNQILAKKNHCTWISRMVELFCSMSLPENYPRKFGGDQQFVSGARYDNCTNAITRTFLRFARLVQLQACDIQTAERQP